MPFARCSQHGRRVCLRCIFFTLGFPVEHTLWEYAPGFRLVTHFLGL